MNDERREFLRAHARDESSYAELLTVFGGMTQQIEKLTRQHEAEETLLRQNRLLADMHHVALNMLNRRELGDLLQYIVDSASDIMNAPFAEILLKSGDDLVVCAVAKATEMQLGESPSREEAQLTWRAFDTQQPVFLDDYQAWPGKRQVFDTIKLHAVAELPIMVGTECLGVLSLARVTPNEPFTPDQMTSYAILIQFIGLILDNTNLYTKALGEIAERERIERELRVSEERYRAVVTMLTEGVVLYDNKGTVLAANPAAERILGLSIAQMDGRLPAPEGWTAIHEDGKPFTRDESPVRAALQTGKPQTDVIMGMKKPDGTQAWVSINAQPMLVAGEPRPVRVVVSFADITQRRLVERQTLELAAEHERAEVLSRFIQNASHEFRTPLAIIQTGAYLMYMSDNPEVKRRKADQIEDQITRITQLVTMLTAQSALDSNAPMTQVPTSVNGLIEYCADKLKALIQRREITLTLNLDPGQPEIIGDSDRLGDAFMQLLDNALRFTQSGGEVTVQSRQTAACIVVEFGDTGIGIAADELPHIFERFYRHDDAHTTPGFGLGLSIANKIIERHDGRIEVESTAGIGSIFRVLLPINRLDAAAG